MTRKWILGGETHQITGPFQTQGVEQMPQEGVMSPTSHLPYSYLTQSFSQKEKGATLVTMAKVLPSRGQESLTCRQR